MNIQEEIDQAISDGPEAVFTISQDALMEIGRRWIKAEWQRKNRRANVAHEATVFKDRPEVKIAIQQGLFDVTLRMTRMFANDYTDEFLHSEFTVVEGGETVTMLDATSEQHIRRAEFLENLAAGNAATAVLHRRVISDLAKSGSNSLKEMLDGRG